MKRISALGITRKATLVFRKAPNGKTLVFGILDDQPFPGNDCAVLAQITGLVGEDRTQEYAGQSYPSIIGQGIEPVESRHLETGLTLEEATALCDGVAKIQKGAAV